MLLRELWVQSRTPTLHQQIKLQSTCVQRAETDHLENGYCVSTPWSDPRRRSPVSPPNLLSTELSSAPSNVGVSLKRPCLVSSQKHTSDILVYFLLLTLTFLLFLPSLSLSRSFCFNASALFLFFPFTSSACLESYSQRWWCAQVLFQCLFVASMCVMECNVVCLHVICC